MNMRIENGDIAGGPTRPMVKLPARAANGHEVDLFVDRDGAYGGPYVWRMKYLAGSSFAPGRWYPVGHVPPLLSYQSGGATGSLTNNAVSEYANTPNIDMPFSGLWEFDIGVTYVSSAGSTAQWITGLRVGSTDDPGLVLNGSGDQTLVYYPVASPPGGYSQAIQQFRSDIRYVVSAGTNVRMRHYTINAQPGIASRLVAARPLRLYP